jgi:hypothetical protein
VQFFPVKLDQENFTDVLFVAEQIIKQAGGIVSHLELLDGKRWQSWWNLFLHRRTAAEKSRKKYNSDN